MSTDPAAGMSERGWPLWEVFVRAKRGLLAVISDARTTQSETPSWRRV